MKLKYPAVEALRDAYDFRNLQSILDIYHEGANVLRDEDDFHAMTATWAPDRRWRRCSERDPAYVGGYILENYLEAQRALGLVRADITLLAGNSITASFLPFADKQAWLARIERYEAAGAASISPRSAAPKR